MNQLSLRYIILCVLILSVISPARGQSSAGSNIVSRTVLSGDGMKAAEHHVYDNGLAHKGSVPLCSGTNIKLKLMETTVDAVTNKHQEEQKRKEEDDNK